LVAAVGLENMIVVETSDALLVCSKEKAQDVKKVVEHWKRLGERSCFDERSEESNMFLCYAAVSIILISGSIIYL
jgi:hypothetical protein